MSKQQSLQNNFSLLYKFISLNAEEIEVHEVIEEMTKVPQMELHFKYIGCYAVVHKEADAHPWKPKMTIKNPK